MTNVDALIDALNSDDVEIIIRKKAGERPAPPSDNALHASVLDILSGKVGMTGKDIREEIARERGVDPAPIANEVAWALVELQSSTRKRSSFIDNQGPIEKIGKHYRLRKTDVSAS